MNSRILAAFIVLALTPIGRAAPQTAAPQRDLLIIMAGTDTFSVERFLHTATRLESELLIRPAAARFTFSVELAPDGGSTRLDNAYRQASADPASRPLQSAVVRFTRDSAIAVITSGDQTVTQRFATRAGVIPFINPSMSLAELIIHRARVIGGDSVQVPIWSVQGGTTVLVDVVRVGRDSVVLNINGARARLAVDARGDIVGGAVPAQGLRVLRVRGADGRAMSVAKPDYSAASDAPYTAEDVTIPTTMGFSLAGTLTIPRGVSHRVPAIVTITGSGLQDRDEEISMVKGYRPFRQIADSLGRHGIAVLRMDDRGFGGSGGDATRATSADFANDVKAGLAYLRTRPEIDPARLGLVGHSEGGLIAPLVAADDASLRAIVLMAGPAQKGRTILDYQQRFAIERNTMLSAAQRDSAYRTVPGLLDSLATALPWMKFFLDYDPLVTARRVKVPTLILHGATDRQVTALQANELAKALRAGGNRDVTVHVFANANHLFVQDSIGNPAGYSALPQGAIRSDVLATLVDWLRVKLR